LDAPTHGNATLFAAFHRANLALSSIAAPTTATVFLQVSLSKMPRSIRRSLSILPEAFPIKANDYRDKWQGERFSILAHGYPISEVIGLSRVG
jgi:hypothetical protein